MSFDYYRRYTQARIGLGNAGHALPTKAWLEFSYHHACAVDAINAPWDLKNQRKNLEKLGYETHTLRTQVANREEYLLRPDLGRLLDKDAKKVLKNLGPAKGDIAILVSNGLSSLALENHLQNFLEIFLKNLLDAKLPIAHDCIFFAQNGRVALIDDVGALLKPKIGITIIGERPGLSAPDSLAVYLTYHPEKKRSDAERNCISNIRPPHGLSYEEAAHKSLYLVKESLKRKLSGIHLKDESENRLEGRRTA